MVENKFYIYILLSFVIVNIPFEFYQVHAAQRSAQPELNSRANVRIIVIGGGISGLVASARLRNLGYNVTLFEAADRVGGRIHTEEFGNGQYVELGAEWIHGETNNRIYQLMEQLEVFVSEDVDGIYLFVNQSGFILNSEFNKQIYELATAIKDHADVADALHNRNASVGEMASRIFRYFMKRLKKPFRLQRPCMEYAALDWIHRNTNLEDSADDWFQTSAVKDLIATTCPGNQGVYWKRPYTYTTLLKYVMTGELEDRPLHVQIPHWIHLGTEVVEIQYSTENTNMKVKVLCMDGSQHDADHVISTVSLGVLKERHSRMFKPALSLRKQLAIKHLGFGSVNKIYLNFAAPFWLNRTAEEYDDQEDPNVEPDEILDGVQFLWEENNDNCSLDSFNETMLTGHWARNVSRIDLLKEDDGIPEWARDLSGINTIRNHPTAMRAFVTGSCARLIETLEIENIEVIMMRLIRKFGSRKFKEIPDSVNITTSKWQSNPFTRGSYSFQTVDSQVHQVFAEDLAIPVENTEGKPIICFAGEATHPQYYSHAHGAFDTGLREGERIHKFYQKAEYNILISSDANHLFSENFASFKFLLMLYGILVVLSHI